MRLNRHGFTSEAQLVARTRDWLQADGWTCYFECAPWGSGASRADIVATRGPLLAIIECKLTLSLALLEQCRFWARYAHVTWGATPSGKHSHFAREIAGMVGCGLVEIGSDTYDRAQITRQPEFRRRVDHERVRRHLGEAQATTRPGASHSYSTPFTQTCSRLLGVVRDAGGRLHVKQALTGLEHHYSSTSCARSSLISRTKQGVVPGLRVVKEGRALYFEVTP